jgi:predicted nucleotidyltransferase
MYSQSDVNRIVKEVLLLISTEFPLEKVYLFGSYSHSTAGKYSDIDLAIVSDKFEGNSSSIRKNLTNFC